MRREELEPGLDETAFYDPKNFTFPGGCHVAEIEIDPETGVTTVVNFCAVDDVGRVINPMIVEGQVHGGLADGVQRFEFEAVVARGGEVEFPEVGGAGLGHGDIVGGAADAEAKLRGLAGGKFENESGAQGAGVGQDRHLQRVAGERLDNDAVDRQRHSRAAGFREAAEAAARSIDRMVGVTSLVVPPETGQFALR